MRRVHQVIFLFLVGGVLLFGYGCGGPTRAVIPNDIQPMSDHHARIVVTREDQIAGMTTPLYIIEAGDAIETNATIKIRVGDWRKSGASPKLFDPWLLWVIIPQMRMSFAETDQTLDDLIEHNLDAIVYVDYLHCDPQSLDYLYCGNGKKACGDAFYTQLDASKGMIIGDLAQRQAVEKQPRPTGVRDVKVIGKIFVGDSLVWDRAPGIMRVGALWGATAKSEQILNLIPANMKVAAGKTYYLHYSTKFGERWKLTKVE
jgi:hypothetical protein